MFFSRLGTPCVTSSRATSASTRSPATAVPASSATTLNKSVAATDTTERTGPITRIVNSLKATPGGGASTESTVGKHRAPTTGGLSNLFKKKDDTKADTTTKTESTD